MIVKKQRGISLLEIMLTLTVAVGLLAGAMRFYSYVTDERKSTDLVQQISAIKAALNRWYVTVGNLNTVSMPKLIAQNFLPPGSDESPWGGAITVQPIVAVHTIKAIVQVTDVPATTCNLLARNFPGGKSGVHVSQCQSNNKNNVASYFMIVQSE